MTPSLREHSAEREIPESSTMLLYHPLHLVNCEPGSSLYYPIDLEDEEHDTEPLSDDQETLPLGGDTERESDSETGDEGNSEAISIQDESQTQPQSGSRPTARPEPKPEAIKASEQGITNEAKDNRLDFLLWAPSWRSENEVAKVAPGQLKRYKGKLDIGLASRASQARKRVRSPLPEPRRSSRQKKPRLYALYQL
ncbi:hypothetical protein FQN50_006139 [Emmonsiellopsis sp. PD_5]|nr:hypothetical protein FQN50_006139 [Emmonsiellopsis sp. PD_5]